LLATSDGEIIENPKWYRAEQKQLRVLQRRVSRRRLGGRNRYKARVFVQRQQAHVSARRKDFLNKTADYFIQKYDKIVLEALQIDKMVKNHAESTQFPKYNLSKSILDAGWGYFTKRLLDKAAEAGREIVFVKPAGTSKTCSSCGAKFEGLTLKDRWVKCKCGLSMDRDINAAINILHRAGQVRWSISKTNRLRLLQEAPLIY
jgi:putative transposase